MEKDDEFGASCAQQQPPCRPHESTQRHTPRQDAHMSTADKLLTAHHHPKACTHTHTHSPGITGDSVGPPKITPVFVRHMNGRAGCEEGKNQDETINDTTSCCHYDTKQASQ